MIQIETDRFSCNCCFSRDSVKSISFFNRMGNAKNGICVCLCDKCRKELYEMLKGEFGE